jgi:competence protein ComEC
MHLFAEVKRNPFVRLLLCYMAGILLAGTTNGNHATFIPALVALIATATMVLIRICKKPGYHTGWVFGLIASCIFILAGFFNMKTRQHACANMKKNEGTSGTFLLEIVEPPECKTNTVNAIALIRDYMSKGTILKQHQRISVLITRDNLASTLETGDRLIARGILHNLKPPGNPCEFDYSQYMAAHGICNRMFLKHGQWEKTQAGKRTSIRVLSLQFQKKLLNRYQQIGLNKTLFSILSALTLGYKNDLESHTRQAFCQAGVMHVMALSGFNVAVIAAMMGFLLFFAQRSYPGKVLKAVFIILVIWIFAFVTGLSPSVLRAAVMISFVITGQLIHRKINTFNILYASAFFLLLMAPDLIYNVSFQLSFAAVIGIILFQPIFQKTISLKNKFLNYLWQLFTVSCAAQFSTLPITLYYFHQFPVYFWLTNLYVVPLVSVIICMSMVYLLVSPIQVLMHVTSQILILLLEILYKAVSFTEVLPFSLIENLYITKFQVLVLVLLILFMGKYLLQRNKLYLLLAMTLLAFFLFLSVSNANKFNKQQLLMVGNLKGYSVIHAIAGRECVLICDPVPSPEDQRFNYAFGNFWNKQGVANHLQFLNVGSCCWKTLNNLPVQFYSLPDLPNCLLIHHAGKRIILLNGNLPSQFNGKPFITDVVLINNRLKPDLKALMRLFSFKMLVIDSSVDKYKARLWEDACRKAGLPCWNVIRQGAYLLSIQ